MRPSYATIVLAAGSLACESPSTVASSPGVVPTQHAPVVRGAERPAATTPVPSRVAAAPVPDRRTLWRADVDLDGDGATEHVALTSDDVAESKADDPAATPAIGIQVARCVSREPSVDGCRASLEVGASRHELVLRAGYFGGIGARPIDIDPSDRHTEILLTERAGDTEDPPFVFSVVSYRGGKLRVQRLFASSGYGSGEVKLDGKGALTVVYAECPDRTSVRYRWKRDELVQVEKRAERVRDPKSCAACPRVFVQQASGFVLKGEVLRNLKGPELRAYQSLELAHPERFVVDGGSISVLIGEEEPETTTLHAATLEVDGRAYAAERFVPVVLERGDEIELRFATGPLGASSQVRLWVDGYYVAH